MTDPDDSAFLNIEGSMSEDWTTEEGPPVTGCWVCERPLIGRQRPSNFTPGTPLIGKCDRVFILTLTASEDLGADGTEIQQWLMCGPDCWSEARRVIADLIHRVGEHEPIFTSWSEDFQELTGLDE